MCGRNENGFHQWLLAMPFCLMMCEVAPSGCSWVHTLRIWTPIPDVGAQGNGKVNTAFTLPRRCRAVANPLSKSSLLGQPLLVTNISQGTREGWVSSDVLGSAVSHGGLATSCGDWWAVKTGEKVV